MPVVLHLSEKPLLYVGTVSYEDGTNVYLAWSLPDLRQQVAEFCRAWWDEVSADSDLDPLVACDQDIIDDYFGNHDKDTWDWVKHPLPPLPGT